MVDNVGKGGNRLATMLWYLDSPTIGGETHFPCALDTVCLGGEDIQGYPVPKYCQDSRVGVKVPPKPGLATLFYSLRPDGAPDGFSLHAGCPPAGSGSKWAVNKCEYDTPQLHDCPHPVQPSPKVMLCVSIKSVAHLTAAVLCRALVRCCSLLLRLLPYCSIQGSGISRGLLKAGANPNISCMTTTISFCSSKNCRTSTARAHCKHPTISNVKQYGWICEQHCRISIEYRLHIASIYTVDISIQLVVF